MDLRRHVRAGLHTQVKLQGTDRWGKPFEVSGESVDFSRKGMGFIIDRDLLAPGSVVSLSVPRKLASNAVVQWTGSDASSGQVRVGVRLLNPKASLGFRLLACFLLSITALSQVSFPKARAFPRFTKSQCGVSLAEMKSVLENTLGKFAYLSNSEMAFLHVQHQRMSCEEYTRLFEKSDFYKDEKKRGAISYWHWNTYHSQDAKVRARAMQKLDETLAVAD